MRAASGSAASPGGWSNRNFWAIPVGRKGLWHLALACCCAGLPFAAAAVEKTDKKPSGLSNVPFGAEGLFETAAGLLLVVATIIALSWLARRYGRFPMAAKGLVNVLGGITLGSRERVVVVQVDDTRLVLGVAPGRIQTLYVLDRADDGDRSFSKALEAELPESQ